MSSNAGQGRARSLAGGDAFRRRMQYQCEEIKKYRAAVLQADGRELSADEAALEWIERYAESFASNWT